MEPPNVITYLIQVNNYPFDKYYYLGRGGRNMSRVVSFSVDNKFADELENLVETSGYANRSRFLRDASLHFAEELQRGSIETMDAETKIEGILIVFFQHGIEQKLHDIRHSGKIEVTSYSHTSLFSNSCVDTMQAFGTAGNLRTVMQQLQTTQDVDRVSFVPAPLRDHGCC